MEATGEQAIEWAPAGIWRTLANAGQKVAMLLGIVFSLLVLTHTKLWALWLVGLFLVAVWIHEAGHGIAARAGGMLLVRVDWLIAQSVFAERRRWRFTWCRAFAMAALHPDRPVRRQLLLLQSGGVAANAIVAVACAIAWLFVKHELVAVLGVLNAMFFVANLIPTEERDLSSDGLQLIRLWRGSTDSIGVAYMQAMGQSRLGREVDATLVERMQAGPAPWPDVATWWNLHALLVAGEWTAAAEMHDASDTAKHMPDLLLLMRASLRFARGMAGMEMGRPPNRIERRELEWWAPGLVGRMQAVEALQAGDHTAVRTALVRAERSARRSHDDRHVAQEARFRDAILKRLPSA